MNESDAKLIEVMAEDYDMVLQNAKSMGCNNIRALYNIPLKNMELIVQALEKQIPKKPIEYEDKFYACPICKNTVMHKWEKYNTKLMDKSNGLPVCLNCLQKLDWSDEE